MDEGPDISPQAPLAQEPPKRSKRRLVLSISTQILLIATFVIVTFLMWLPAIVGKK